MTIATATIKILLVLLAVVLLSLGALWIRPPELLRVGANYGAKIVCSNVFLAHRDRSEVLAVDVQAPGNPLLRLVTISVDAEQGLVRANLLGFIGNGIAVYRSGSGCAAVPDGNVSRAKSFSYRTDPIPEPAAEVDWPAGSRVSPNAKVGHVLDDDTLLGPGLRGVAVISHGKLIAQRYAQGFSASTPLLGWSMTKTVNAVLVGTQIKAGRLALRQDHFWPDDGHAGGRDKITLADLLAMSSGLEFNENYGDVSDVTRMLYLEPDMVAFVSAKPLQHRPGTFWNYSTGTSMVLARIWMQAVGADAMRYPRSALFSPLGMSSAIIEVDESGTVSGGSYMYASVQDWARFAEFLLQDGVWDEQRLLPEGFVAMMHTVAPPSKGKYGRGQVWMEGPEARDTREDANADGPFHLPTDIYWMQGHDGQVVALIPSLQLAVIRMGLTPDELFYQPQSLVAAVIEALKS
jgi:CubicO group peptidase (beta-lactamase class C family)